MAMETSHEIFREWDLYDRIGHADLMRHQRIAAGLRPLLGVMSGPLRVLDLGCGNGWMAHLVLAECDVSEFVGVDLSPSAIDRLARSPMPGIRPERVRRELIRGDIASQVSRLPNAGFDVVHASYALHHLTTDIKAESLRQIARTLRPGGRLLWTDIITREGETREGYINRLAREILTHWHGIAPDERESVVAHVREFDHPESPGWMARELGAAGLRLIATAFHDDYYASFVFEK